MKMLISRDELNSKGSRELIPLECYQCGNTHYRTKNVVLSILSGNKKTRGCYCSKVCMGLSRQMPKITRNCKQCGNELERSSTDGDGNVFCNTSCSAKYNNKWRVIQACKDNTITIKIENNTPIKYRKCKYCQSEFKIKNRNTQLYCSSKCKADEIRHTVYKNIDSGIVNGHSASTMRNYLLLKRGCKCEICGITEWGGKPLTVIMDHIDGNSDHWDVTNLRLICSNCDTLTPNLQKKKLR